MAGGTERADALLEVDLREWVQALFQVLEPELLPVVLVPFLELLLVLALACRLGC